MWCQYADLSLQRCLYPRLPQRPLCEFLYWWWLFGKWQMSDSGKVPCKWAGEGEHNFLEHRAKNSNVPTYPSITSALLPSTMLWQGADPGYLGREPTFPEFIRGSVSAVSRQLCTPSFRGRAVQWAARPGGVSWMASLIVNHRVSGFIYPSPQWSRMRHFGKA